MKSYIKTKIESNRTTIIITHEPKIPLAIIIPVFFSLISFAIPLLLIIFFNLPVLKLGVLISILIFWGTSFFFFRISAWNLFGKEVYIIEKDHIVSYYDYKFFIENRKNNPYTKLTIELMSKYSNEVIECSKSIENSNEECKLCFVIDNEIMESVSFVKASEIYSLYCLLQNKTYSLS